MLQEKLNTKIELNIYTIPRMISKLGYKLYQKWADERELKRTEAILEERIRNIINLKELVDKV